MNCFRIVVGLLGLRPRERAPIIAELLPSSLARELPATDGLVAVDLAVPHQSFALELWMFEIRRVPRHWRVKRLISVSAWLSQLPETGAPTLAEVIGRRPAAMDVEIVHHQVKGAGKGIAANDPQPSG